MNTQLLKSMVSPMKSVQMALAELLAVTEERMSDKKDGYTKYIQEEFNEFMAEKDGTPEQAKELGDLLWVVIQKANKQGYDLSKILQMLVDEYSSKFYDENGEFNPIYREDGKLLKNKGFKKLDLTKIL